jgi:hypothetical protein
MVIFNHTALWIVVMLSSNQDLLNWQLNRRSMRKSLVTRR